MFKEMDYYCLSKHKQISVSQKILISLNKNKHIPSELIFIKTKRI